MLGQTGDARQFAMIGPSVGGPPDPLFARGVTFLGGHWITNGAGFLDALARGESTSPFARKTGLRTEDYPGWNALLSRL